MNFCHSQLVTCYLKKQKIAAKGNESIDERNESLLLALFVDRFFGPHE